MDTQSKSHSGTDYLRNKNSLSVVDFSKSISKPNPGTVKNESCVWDLTDSLKTSRNFSLSQSLERGRAAMKLSAVEDIQFKERITNLPTINKSRDNVIGKFSSSRGSSKLKSSSSYSGITQQIVPKKSQTHTKPLQSHSFIQYSKNRFNVKNNVISKPSGNNNMSPKLPSFNNHICSQLYEKDSTTAAIVPNEVTRSIPNGIQNDAVIVEPPKVLVINQPAQKNDPLNLLSSRAIRKSNSNNQINIDSQPTIDHKLKKTENSTNTTPESEVIKRIIYHSKYAQTK